MEMNHVLIVEDDKEIREGVKIYLKSKGYEVSEAADGAVSYTHLTLPTKLEV